MRLAYVAEWDPYTPSGVLTKIYSQAKAWKRLGHEVALFLVYPPRRHVSPVVEETVVIGRELVSYLPRRVRFYANKVFSIRSLSAALHAFRAEVVYYRKGTWYPGLVSVLSRYPYIVEINTYEQGELRGLRRFINGWSEGLFRKARGVITVTREIANYLRLSNVPIHVGSNGYDLSAVMPRPVPRNDRPALILVGSPGQSWHGVDKVVRLASLLPEFDFHIVGPDDDGTRYPANVRFHGYLPSDQLLQIYSRMDVGIGTLALHRKHMEEACPLKVREYLAVGLPVVIGYRDPDLQDCEFVLEIENRDDNVVRYADDIREFVGKWKDNPLPREEVRNRVDIVVKEQRKLDFVREVCGT